MKYKKVCVKALRMSFPMKFIGLRNITHKLGIKQMRGYFSVLFVLYVPL